MKKRSLTLSTSSSHDSNFPRYRNRLESLFETLAAKREARGKENKGRLATSSKSGDIGSAPSKPVKAVKSCCLKPNETHSFGTATASSASELATQLVHTRDRFLSQDSSDCDIVRLSIEFEHADLSKNSTVDDLLRTMDANRKPVAAPPIPPPPVPTHKLTSTMVSTTPINGSSGHGPSPSVRVTVGEVEHIRTLTLNGHVGFDSLPHQLVSKATEHGFQFNLMCVGETGIGKTTLIESLFNRKLEFEPCNHELKTVELRTKTMDIDEAGVRLKLTIVETAGFGDQLDKEKSTKVIGDYINEQFEGYLKEELKIRRCLELYSDTRIHACLYFISPTGHGLKALDVVTMRELSKRVNVIPVIAKSDTTCKDELQRFKAKILSELNSQNIHIYQFPTDDETVSAINIELNRLIPYAIVGSIDFVKRPDGKEVRARRYPWGMVEVENEEHCDFVRLREALLRTNVDALRERTHKTLYEAYRRDRLREMNVGDGDTGPKLMQAFAQKSKELAEEMERQERERRDDFVKRVSLKEDELKRREEILNLREKEQDDRFQKEMKQFDQQIQVMVEEKAKLEAKIRKHRK